MNKDFINILRDIRGSAAPGEQSTDGIWYELTMADKNGNAGIYGDILAKYGVVTESAGTFDQAVAILENLNVEITTLPAGTQATSALVNGVWQIGIPIGTAGIDGIDGFTPVVAMNYSLGNLNYTVTVDGTQITNTVLVELDELIDTRVNANVDVQTTLVAKQEVLDSVEVAQAVVNGLDTNVANKIIELTNHTTTKIGELDIASTAEQLEISNVADAKKLIYDQNTTVRVTQYNDNHIAKLATYIANAGLKIEQYNENHIDKLKDINYAYADRIVEMIKTRNFMGIMDEYVAQTDTHMITFLDTTDANYIYYSNGILLVENVDYTVYDSTTIELTVKANPYDVIVQVNTQVLNDMLTAEGVLFGDRIGQPNGIAGLDENGQVPSVQLPSYIDAVLEFSNLATFPAIGETEKIYVALDTNKTYRWSGSVYVYITSGAVDSVAGKTGVVTLVKSDVGLSNVDNTADATKKVASADKLTTTRTISITGDATGSVAFDGSTDVSITATVGDDTHSHGDSTITDVAWSKISSKPDPVVTVTLTGDVTGTANATMTDMGNATVTVTTTVAANSVALGTDTTGNYVADVTAGTYVTKSGTAGEGWSPTINVDATSTNTVSKVVARDASGNFAAGTITAALTGNASTATKLATARNITLSGDVTGTVNFDGSAGVSITTTVADDSHLHAFTNLTSKPTTVSGYGITDAYTKTESDAVSSLKANLVSPTLTGTPTAPTASVGTNTTQLATTAFVNAEIANDTYSKTELNTSNVFRADKYLAAQNVVNMAYDVNGKLSKVQYNNATDVNYEVLTYNVEGKLSNVAHYVTSVLKGNTVLGYSLGKLVSAQFMAI